MNKILYFLLLLIAISAVECGTKSGNKSAEQTVQSGKAIIVFKQYEHDFGKVVEGQKIAFMFSFENTGTGDLIISRATTTCGCTVPKYDTKPIPPGKGGNLEVVFDTSGREGMQTKTITVKSNASVPVVLLKITAEVETTIN